MSIPRTSVLLSSVVVLAVLCFPAVAPGQEAVAPGQEKGAKGDEGKKEGKGTTKVLNIDEQYVKDNLEKHIFPTKIEWLDDGRVKMVFDFRQKKDEHIDVFTPRIGARIKDRFRWSLPDEEHWSGADGNDIGLRVSNDGQALLNCWFVDEFEAEMYFLQKVNFNARQYAALVFCNDKGTAIGSNFGTMCAMFQRGRFKGGRGKVDPVINDGTNKFGLVVGDGKFEVKRSGRVRASMKYPKKSFKSGRLGIAWGGNVMGYVAEISVTGKLDSKKMAKLLQKGRR